MQQLTKYIFLILILFPAVSISQPPLPYWNKNTQLLPWRISPAVTQHRHIDIDKDGDPDILKAQLNDSIPILWIDDDDDMRWSDREGDTDNDCLLIDRNKDGVFAGPWDFSIDWYDKNNDGKADLQLIVNNAGLKVRNYFDWGADFMYILDDDNDQIMHYVDWNKIMMQAWEHSGHANFFKDYSGNTTFLKMHGSSFRIDDLRFNWENPFIFFDPDKDGLTEWAIRLVDSPVFRNADSTENGFDKLDPAFDIKFTRSIDYAAITWDLDGDNGPGNEFDYDMSILFKGKGFNYEDQKHDFKNMPGKPDTDSFFYDARWRKIDQLFFPGRDTAYSLIHKRGNWQECRLVFDEDDDCNRWERVEFYDPKNIFIIGTEKGGLDHNKQADAAGDRGEFDLDNSGKGQLYIGSFDGRIHLYGAEWGAWRIDQLAYSFQGFGGNYERWGRDRLQRQPEKFATVKYTDSNSNGFIDLIEYDLDGDATFEDRISLLELGIDDRKSVIEVANAGYEDYKRLFRKVAEDMWAKAQDALQVADAEKLNTYWYAFYKKPLSIHQKYEFGYWLSFYIYQDLRYLAREKGDQERIKQIEKAYYSGDWHQLLKKTK
jgi:hypothetical protein